MFRAGGDGGSGPEFQLFRLQGPLFGVQILGFIGPRVSKAFGLYSRSGG